MNIKYLTANKKAKAYPLIVERDGDICFYCKQPFIAAIHGLRRTFDHLNNNEDDNRLENLVLAHWDCNEKKKTDLDMQVQAHEKLKENVRLASVEPLRDSDLEKKNMPDTTENELTEGEINAIINKIADTFLSEKLKDTEPDTFLPFTDTLNSITYLVQKETSGRGSPPAVRRALDVRCCSIADYKVTRENGKRVIRRRRQN